MDNEVATLSDFELLDENYNSILDAQVDVNTEITCNITVEDLNGWDDIYSVKILCYYDGGNDSNDFDDQTTGRNYKFMLEYSNWIGQSAPTTSYMSVEYDDSTDNNLISEGSHAVSQITSNLKYKLTWKFTLGYQFKQADIPDNFDGTSYANTNSWNVLAEASDRGSTTIQSHDGEDAYEFGICKYVYLDSQTTTWDVGGVVPGANSDATPSPVISRSNDDFDLTVWQQGDLTCTNPSMTLPTSEGYVTVLASATSSDDISTNQVFADNGEGNEETILANGGHGDHSAYRAYNSQVSTYVNFNIAVPYGTLPGVFTAGLTFKVVQVP